MCKVFFYLMRQLTMYVNGYINVCNNCWVNLNSCTTRGTSLMWISRSSNVTWLCIVDRITKRRINSIGVSKTDGQADREWEKYCMVVELRFKFISIHGMKSLLYSRLHVFVFIIVVVISLVENYIILKDVDVDDNDDGEVWGKKRRIKTSAACTCFTVTRPSCTFTNFQKLTWHYLNQFEKCVGSAQDEAALKFC